MAAKPPPPDGFTLLEMLLVLAILGILATVVALGFTDSGRHRHLRAEAERLSRLVELARGEALRRNEIWGLRVADGRYGFQRYEPAGGDWMEVVRRPFRARPAEESVTFRIATNAGDRQRLKEQLQILRGAAANSDGEEAEPPDVAIFPDGEVTPFEVTIFLAGPERGRSQQARLRRGGENDEDAWLAGTDGIQPVRARSVRDAAREGREDLLADLVW